MVNPNPGGSYGILYNVNPGSTTCNGRLAQPAANDPYVTLSDCLHVDDIAAATIPDSSQAAIKPAV